MRKTEKITLDVKFSLQSLEDVDNCFAKGLIAIGYAGRNRNKSDISEEVFMESLPSLVNKPVVGRFLPDDADFGEHEFETVTDPNTGEVEVVPITIPFGVIPESATQYWDTIEEDGGLERRYLFTEVLIWKRQYGYKTLLEKGVWNQSMEINVLDYELDKDGYFIIKQMEFEALCILGQNVEPCFESASLQMFSQNTASKFKTQFSLMLKELQELTQNTIKTDGKEDGGNMSEPMTNPIIANPEDIVEPVAEPVTKDVEPITEPVVEPTVNQTEPVTEPTTPVTEPVSEPVSEPVVEPQYTRSFTLSHDDIRCKLYEALSPLEESNNACYYIDAVYDDYFDYTDWNEAEYKCKRRKYTVNEDDTITVDSEEIEIFIERLTAQEKSALDMLRNNYSALENEVKELKEYKASIEEAQNTQAKTEMLSKWESALGAENETYKAIADKADTYSLNELETALKVAFADTKATFSMSTRKKNATTVKVSATDTTSENVENGYDWLFAKYGVKPQK